MLISVLFVISAALPLLMAIFRHKASSVLLLASTTIYFLICAIASGRLSGIIPTQSIAEIVNQHGFDPNSLFMPIDTGIELAQIVIVIFNIFCTFWIWHGYGFWSWFLTCIGIFFIVGGFAGIVLQVNPIYIWFGACCGIMLIVGWVLGLSYIEFCVIGNIWLPALTIIASAISMMVNVKKSPWILKSGCYIFGILQIVAMLLLLLHYWGSMDCAFYLCVRDLRNLASHFHTTYEIVNIIVYFPLFILPLLVNLSLPHFARLDFRGKDESMIQDTAHGR